MTTATIHKLPVRKKSPECWQPLSDNLVLHKPSGVYYVRKFKAGKGRLFKTTGCDTKGLAKTKAGLMIQEWMDGGPKKLKLDTITINSVCDELELTLRKEFENGDRRIRTWEHDQGYLPIIKRYFGGCLVDQIDEQFWDDWVRTTGRSTNRTLCDIAKYLSKTLTFAYQRKYINRKPQLKNPDKPKKSGMIYENSDIETFIQHSDPMLRDLIIIAAECGLRPHENIGLKWEWIQFESDRVLIHIPADFAKTGSARSFETSPNVGTVLRVRFKNKVGPHVFPAPKNDQDSLSRWHMATLWQAMIKRAKYPKECRFHWLRHSFFTKALLDAKLPLAEVSQYGGNSPAILMKRYLQNDPNRTRSVAHAVSLNLGEKSDI